MRRLLVLCAAVVLACHHAPTSGDLVAAGDREAARESVPALRAAAALYEKALPGARDDAARARIHARLADAYLTVDLSRADGELAQAIRLGDPDTALAARALRAFRGEEPIAARIATLRALAGEARAARARRAELDATIFLGKLVVEARNMNEGATILEGARALLDAAPDARHEAELERWIGISYYALGDADRALPHFLRAQAVAQAAHLPLQEVSAARLLANFHLWLKRDGATSLVYFSRAVAGLALLGRSRMSEGIETRASVAVAQTLLGDAQGALATLDAALADGRALGTDQVLIPTLIAIGGAYAKVGRNDEARKAYAEAAARARRADDMHQHTLAILGAAEVDLAERRFREAEATVNQAIEFIAAKEALVTDERLRLSFAGAMRNGQMYLLEALIGQQDWRRAFAASERLRSRRLLAALGSDEIVDGDGARALLDADTTMVEYAFVRSRLEAFVVDAGAVRGFDLGKAKDAQAAARSWYELASAPATPAGALDAATRALADRILTPLVPHLRGRRLAIVPDRALHFVAFATLPLPDGRPLIERFELVHLPSASVLAALRRRTDRRPRPVLEVAILADPVFDRNDPRLGGPAPPAATLVAMRTAGDGDFARLASTHAEAEAIAKLVPPDRLFLAEGAAATRAAALGPEVSAARFVHFATHAVTDSVDAEKSGLVFTRVGAGGAPVDGFVRLADIEASHLSAELVVLSACRTAIGKAFDGEGLVGLTRAFLRAGVPRIVSSLWQVDDAATAELMGRFYRGLLGEHLSAPAALRRAQREAGVDRRLWAAFAFYGDWR